MKLKSNAGFSLVEVMVAIAILGLITIPVTSGMLVAMKTMAKTEGLLQSQLAVSSAVESLMAEGIEKDSELPTFPGVEITATQAEKNGADLPYYYVTVKSEDGSVLVETVIREEVGTP